MDINNNTNISSIVSQSLSNIKLNTANKNYKADSEINSKEKEEILKEDKKLLSENKSKNNVNVEEIQQYASLMGENLSVEDINYGIMYGRSVIADYSA